jgi:hypothetical protein
MASNISIAIISGRNSYFYTWEHLSLHYRYLTQDLEIYDLLSWVHVILIGQTDVES